MHLLMTVYSECSVNLYLSAKLLVLLRWQEFATRLVAVFFDMPSRCRWRWRISVGVKARVVNLKQADVAASTLFWLFWNVLIAHCTQQ